MTKRERILDFIRSSADGRSYAEIQKFICTMNGLDWEERQIEQVFIPVSAKYLREHPGYAYYYRPSLQYRRVHRGYYGTNLYRTYTGKVLFRTKCKKVNGKWKIKLT